MLVEELVSRLGLEIDEAAWAKGEALVEGLHEGMLALGAAAMGAAAVGFAFLVNSTAEAGEAALHLAQSTGLSSDQLQELGYAAKISNVSMEQLSGGMRHLARMGIKDINGEMLRLADQFEKMPDGGEKVQLAMLKMGRGGAALIPMLNKGRAELQKMMVQAHLTGNVMSKEALKAAERYRESIARLEATFTGLRNRIAEPFLDAFGKAIDWVSDHSDELVFVLKLIGLTLGGLAVAFVAAQAAAIGAAIATAAGWLLAAAPFILIGLILEDIYGYFNGKDSLIGRMDDFLSKFAQPHAGDPWWLAALREAAYFVTHLYEIIPNLFDKIGEARDWVIGHAGGAGFVGDPSVAFGGGASPAVSQTLDARPRPTGAVFQASVTVNAQTGASAQDIAGHVATAIKDAHRATMREAAAGIR